MSRFQIPTLNLNTAPGPDWVHMASIHTKSLVSNNVLGFPVSGIGYHHWIFLFLQDAALKAGPNASPPDEILECSPCQRCHCIKKKMLICTRCLRTHFCSLVCKKRKLQWGSENRTWPVFEWSKVDRFTNGPVFEWNPKTGHMSGFRM